MIIFVVLFVTSFIGTSVLGGTESVNQSARGFIASKVNSSLNLNDGQIDPFWSEISTYQNISEFGEGGLVKFSNNGSHLFSLIVYPQNNDWVSIEFEPEPEACMANLNDGWSFYVEQNPDQVEARDIKFKGVTMPDTDAQTDLSIEAIFNNSMVYVELVRQFDTGDIDGLDVLFYNGSVNMMQFASKDDHIGFHEDFYILITDKLVGVGSETPVIDIPVGANLGQIKFILLGVTPLGILIFIGLHAIRRVFTNPIEHKYNRVVTDGHNPPSFVKRWKETFSSK
jgi:hypothetical protein